MNIPFLADNQWSTTPTGVLHFGTVGFQQHAIFTPLQTLYFDAEWEQGAGRNGASRLTLVTRVELVPVEL